MGLSDAGAAEEEDPETGDDQSTASTLRCARPFADHRNTVSSIRYRAISHVALRNRHLCFIYQSTTHVTLRNPLLVLYANALGAR